MPPRYAPFGIRVINGKLYVTFAEQNKEKHDDKAGPNHGFVDVFDLDGSNRHRLVSRHGLNSPWGLALAPANFGKFSNALLVGNFGNGHISAYDPNSGAFLGQLQDQNGQVLTIDGLWTITFGNGVSTPVQRTRSSSPPASTASLTGFSASWTRFSNCLLSLLTRLRGLASEGWPFFSI